MDKLDVVKKIQEIGVVSVVRGNSPEEAMMMSEACIKGGVTAIELAFTTPRAHELIEALSKKYADNPDVIIGPARSSMPLRPASPSSPVPSSSYRRLWM